MLFTDLKAAFYSTLLETSIDRLLGDPVREQRISKHGFSPAEIRAFQIVYFESPSIVEQCGTAPARATAIAVWHSRTPLTVRHGNRKVAPIRRYSPRRPSC